MQQTPVSERFMCRRSGDQFSANYIQHYLPMNEAEYLMKNYGDRGGCYPSRPYAEADNTLRDLHNCSYDTKAEFNNCFVLLFFQKPLFRLVPAAVLNLETSEVSAILVFRTKTTQPRPQVFSVNGVLTCKRLHF